jgi:hypothetical protein
MRAKPSPAPMQRRERAVRPAAVLTGQARFMHHLVADLAWSNIRLLAAGGRANHGFCSFDDRHP